MKVYGFTGKTHGVMEIQNSLEAWQQFVGGNIEAVSIADHLVLICNEMGKIDDLEKRCTWLDDDKVIDIILGDCFVCRYKGDTEVSIKESDIEVIENVLKPL